MNLKEKVKKALAAVTFCYQVNGFDVKMKITFVLGITLHNLEIILKINSSYALSFLFLRISYDVTLLYIALHPKGSQVVYNHSILLNQSRYPGLNNVFGMAEL